jgi:hypothetical protein
MRRRHMNSGKTIFAQLMDFVPTYEFRKCVDRYNGNHKDQYLCIAFALFYRFYTMTLRGLPNLCPDVTKPALHGSFGPECQLDCIPEKG